MKNRKLDHKSMDSSKSDKRLIKLRLRSPISVANKHLSQTR
jgi:hypothetical protein